jgi:hypothetical protein
VGARHSAARRARRDLDQRRRRARPPKCTDVLRLIDRRRARRPGRQARRERRRRAVRRRPLDRRARAAPHAAAQSDAAAAQRARDYGGQSVLNEIERQVGPGAIGPQRAPSTACAINCASSRMRAISRRRICISRGSRSRGRGGNRSSRTECPERSTHRIAQAAGAAASVLARSRHHGGEGGLIGLSTAARSRTSRRDQRRLRHRPQRDRDGDRRPAHECRGGGGNRSGLRDAAAIRSSSSRRSTAP